jgi:hypothetical protein
MPTPKKTRVPASHSAGVTVPELEQSKAAVLSTLASAHSRRSHKHAIEKFIGPLSARLLTTSVTNVTT